LPLDAHGTDMYGNSYSSNHGEKCNHYDHYDTKKEAMEAARMKGMDGAHKMKCNGKTVWMCGESHADYMDSKEREKSGPVDTSVFGL